MLVLIGATPAGLRRLPDRAVACPQVRNASVIVRRAKYVPALRLVRAVPAYAASSACMRVVDAFSKWCSSL